jgi:hypothetical protein
LEAVNEIAGYNQRGNALLDLKHVVGLLRWNLIALDRQQAGDPAS